MVSESDVRKRDLLEATYPKKTVEIKPDTLPYDYEKIFLRKKNLKKLTKRMVIKESSLLKVIVFQQMNSHY